MRTTQQESVIALTARMSQRAKRPHGTRHRADGPLIDSVDPLLLDIESKAHVRTNPKA